MDIEKKALIEKLAQAEGPSRELDAEIALAQGIVRERDGDCFYGHHYYSVMVLERGYYDHEGNAPELPRYTASIDAALTLVPDGWLPRHIEWVEWLSRSRVQACLLSAEGVVLARSATTPAIAFCIAALSAKEPSQ